MPLFTDLALTRRSVRSFDGRPVSRRNVEICVDAARYAPSACNSQGWRFIGVTDPGVKSAIAADAFGGLYSMNAFASGAGAYIAIVSESIKLPARIGGGLRRTDFSKIDIGIACSYLVLAAQELGIGTCILGWFNEKAVRRILSIPRGKKTDLIIALGYPAGDPPSGRNLKDRDAVVSFEKY